MQVARILHLIEPTGYATDWGGPSAAHAAPLPVYAGARDKFIAIFAQAFSDSGDPKATGPVILKLVDILAPPLRLFLGRSPLAMIRAEYAKRLGGWEKYNDPVEEAPGAR